MRKMWQNYGSNMSGYSAEDYQKVAEGIYGGSLSGYFNEILFGSSAFESELSPLLGSFGLKLSTSDPENSIEKNYGFKISSDKIVIDIDPTSEAYKLIMLKDSVIEMKEIDAGIKIYLERYGQKLHVTVPSSEASYFGILQAERNSTIDGQKLNNLRNWLENCIS